MSRGYECEKNLEVGDNFQVGDILVGKTHMYRTVTYWYKVVRKTKKRLMLKQLDVSYPTQYMSNTPGDACMPVIEKDGKYMCYAGFPYWSGHMEYAEVQASVERYRFDTEKPWTIAASILGDEYAPSLTKWNGEPGWVNCD